MEIKSFFIEHAKTVTDINGVAFSAIKYKDVLKLVKESKIQAVLEREKEITKSIYEMFSVFPDGGIHDFAPDEELVSKNEVLTIVGFKEPCQSYVKKGVVYDCTCGECF